MATAVAVTAATGIYSAYSGYQSAQAQADNIKAQAEQDKMDAEAQMQLDAEAESREASALRDKNRRLRAIQEAAYAKSGVLMEGSAADVLTKQREVDEANVQNIHIAGGNQRAQDRRKVEQDYRSSLYMAKSAKSAAKTNLITGILSTGASAATGMAGMYGGGKTPANPYTGQLSFNVNPRFPTPKPLTMPSSSIGKVGGTNPLLKSII